MPDIIKKEDMKLMPLAAPVASAITDVTRRIKQVREKLPQMKKRGSFIFITGDERKRHGIITGNEQRRIMVIHGLKDGKLRLDFKRRLAIINEV